ncbi:MAG: hypothetical protein IPM79_26625 [Polyangiaceae bacterium]|nr:hypothetical protein [Polyangiaceae bacterium]MBK8941091.1 hypothetical protein [Polyangiaceae bacterium]
MTKEPPRSAHTATRALAAAVLLAVTGCQRPVDPAYLREVEAAASAECACSKDPAQIDACKSEHELYPKPPAGEPSDYEATLDEPSRKQLADARQRFEVCAETRKRAAAFKGMFDDRQQQIMNPERD